MHRSYLLFDVGMPPCAAPVVWHRWIQRSV